MIGITYKYCSMDLHQIYQLFQNLTKVQRINVFKNLNIYINSTAYQVFLIIQSSFYQSQFYYLFNMDILTIQQQLEGRYSNLVSIGTGSYSKVYKAQDKEGRLVAIKVVEIKGMQKEIIPYMVNEVHLLRNARNRNIIRLFEDVQTQNHLFLILEYCEMDVEQMTRKYFPTRKLPKDLVIALMRQVVNGITYLHSQNVIHRDLKLENFAVYLDQQQLAKLKKGDISVLEFAEFKLIDLGLAKQLQDHNSLATTWAGTELNMAPEILLEQEYGFSADMYSLGVCLFQLTTGRYPYSDPTNRIALQDLIKNEDANFQLIEDLELRKLIESMLRFSPLQRISWEQLSQHKYFKVSNDQYIGMNDQVIADNMKIYEEKTFVEQKQESVLKKPAQSNLSQYLPPQTQQISQEHQVYQQSNQHSQQNGYQNGQYSQQQGQQYGQQNGQQFGQQYGQNQFDQQSEFVPQKVFNSDSLIRNGQFNEIPEPYQRDSTISIGNQVIYDPDAQSRQLIKKLYQDRNNYHTIYRASKQLTLIIEVVDPTKYSYLTMKSTLKMYATYFLNIAKQLSEQTKRRAEINNFALKDQQQFLTFKNLLREDQQNIFGFFKQSIEPINIESQEGKRHYDQTNVKIYKILLNIIQDIYYKGDAKNRNEEDIMNKVRQCVYIGMYFFAKGRVIFREDTDTQTDWKKEETWFNEAKDKPEELQIRITDILGQYQLNYD
ncbi:hypothetical protein pb186bvf_006536 [Paramecium bursaria]